jgi:hypothetical protein
MKHDERDAPVEAPGFSRATPARIIERLQPLWNAVQAMNPGAHFRTANHPAHLRLSLPA